MLMGAFRSRAGKLANAEASAFTEGPRVYSIFPTGTSGLEKVLRALWLHRGIEQTGSDFCPKASVSYWSWCRLQRTSKQQLGVLSEREIDIISNAKLLKEGEKREGELESQNAPLHCLDPLLPMKLKGNCTKSMP